jgi:single-strand DNA-binding protein
VTLLRAGTAPAPRRTEEHRTTEKESAVSATEITVIGNVVDSPRRVRLQNGSVTNFRLASTERRFDRESQSWMDGGTFWADVECWGDLGGHVSQTLSKGDPVVVVGTLTTRQWETENGRGSVSQIRAEAVGPNLARGIAEFHRAVRPATPATGPTPADVEGPRPDPAEVDELRAGEDYITDPRTLHDVDPDALLEPALH